jgi:hypothetical protein
MSAKKYLWAITGPVFEVALQVSGINNIFLASGIWCGDAILVIWLSYWSVGNWEKRPGWITKKTSLTLSWLLTAISVLLMFFLVLRPIDNELGTPAITVTATQAVPRNLGTGAPFFVNVTYKIDPGSTLIEAASMGRLLTPTIEISAQDQDTDFRRLREWIMAFKTDEVDRKFKPPVRPPVRSKPAHHSKPALSPS